MTVQELYAKLCDPRFQNPEDGDLFYNFYIYQYPADMEYEMRRQVEEFESGLLRPNNYVKVLTLDLFEEFCRYLDGQPFLKNPSMLQYLLQQERENPDRADRVQSTLQRHAHSEKFLRHLHGLIMQHIDNDKKDEYRRPYVFFLGVGSMYPYLRVSELLAAYEDYNETSKYRIIVFYPGRRDQNSFRLFGTIGDHHTYRATLLINE